MGAGVPVRIESPRPQRLLGLPPPPGCVHARVGSRQPMSRRQLEGAQLVSAASCSLLCEVQWVGADGNFVGGGVEGRPWLPVAVRCDAMTSGSGGTRGAVCLRVRMHTQGSCVRECVCVRARVRAHARVYKGVFVIACSVSGGWCGAGRLAVGRSSRV
jgi:hypothetical protein